MRQRSGQLLPDLEPHELLEAAQEVASRLPSAALVKNEVGNLTIVTNDSTYAGYIDLRTGEVTIFDEAQ